MGNLIGNNFVDRASTALWRPWKGGKTGWGKAGRTFGSIGLAVVTLGAPHLILGSLEVGQMFLRKVGLMGRAKPFNAMNPEDQEDALRVQQAAEKEHSKEIAAAKLQELRDRLDGGSDHRGLDKTFEKFVTSSSQTLNSGFEDSIRLIGDISRDHFKDLNSSQQQEFFQLAQAFISRLENYRRDRRFESPYNESKTLFLDGNIEDINFAIQQAGKTTQEKIDLGVKRNRTDHDISRKVSQFSSSNELGTLAAVLKQANKHAQLIQDIKDNPDDVEKGVQKRIAIKILDRLRDHTPGLEKELNAFEISGGEVQKLEEERSKVGENEQRQINEAVEKLHAALRALHSNPPPTDTEIQAPAAKATIKDEDLITLNQAYKIARELLQKIDDQKNNLTPEKIKQFKLDVDIVLARLRELKEKGDLDPASSGIRKEGDIEEIKQAALNDNTMIEDGIRYLESALDFLASPVSSASSPVSNEALPTDAEIQAATAEAARRAGRRGTDEVED